MKGLILISYLLTTAIVTYAQHKVLNETDTTFDAGANITIPKGDCKTLITDGTFHDSEWKGAILLATPDNYTILIKADEEILAIGLKFPEPKGSLVCEVRITSNDKEVLLLHSSAALGEGVSGFPSTTKFEVGNNKLWEASYVTRIAEKEAEWIAAGKPMERYDDISNKRDGVEFKIFRNKLTSDTLRSTISWFWVEFKDGKRDFRQYNYPVGASLLNSDNWANLILPRELRPKE